MILIEEKMNKKKLNRPMNRLNLTNFKFLFLYDATSITLLLFYILHVDFIKNVYHIFLYLLLNFQVVPCSGS